MGWLLSDIDWSRFDREKLDSKLVNVAKTAALVEANAGDYVTYLKNIFAGDQAFIEAAEIWGREEKQHGAALGRWAEMADPEYNFERALAWFREGYRLPLEAQASVRGSRAGEMIARQVVETGTSSFYTAIRDACEEPVLRQICHHIAADEFAHYRLFQKHYRRYAEEARLSPWARLKIAFSRVQEAEDDELAYAYFAAVEKTADINATYDRKRCSAAYERAAFSLYRKNHIDNATRMILRAADLKSNGRLAHLAVKAFWWVVRWRQNRLAKAI